MLSSRRRGAWCRDWHPARRDAIRACLYRGLAVRCHAAHESVRVARQDADAPAADVQDALRRWGRPSRESVALGPPPQFQGSLNQALARMAPLARAGRRQCTLAGPHCTRSPQHVAGLGTALAPGQSSPSVGALGWLWQGCAGRSPRACREARAGGGMAAAGVIWSRGLY